MAIDWIVEFSHFQFALLDAGDVSNWDFTDSQLSNRAMVNEDLTGFCIFSPRHGRFAQLQIEVADSRPDLDLEHWDHVVELNFWTLSGEMEISTVYGDRVYDPVSKAHLRGAFPVEPGIYQLYVLFANLASMEMRLSKASDAEYTELFYGYSGENSGDGIPDIETLKNYDRYRVIMWRARDRVIKRFGRSS